MHKFRRQPKIGWEDTPIPSEISFGMVFLDDEEGEETYLQGLRSLIRKYLEKNTWPPRRKGTSWMEVYDQDVFEMIEEEAKEMACRC